MANQEKITRKYLTVPYLSMNTSCIMHILCTFSRFLIKDNHCPKNETVAILSQPLTQWQPARTKMMGKTYFKAPPMIVWVWQITYLYSTEAEAIQSRTCFILKMNNRKENCFCFSILFCFCFTKEKVLYM